MLEFFVAVVSVIILVVFYLRYSAFINKHSNFIQLIMVFLAAYSIVTTILYARKQINEMHKIEEDKKQIAIESLITELKYNNTIINDYIQHAESGGTVTPKPGGIDIELDVLQTKAYETYLTIACGGGSRLAINIISLYMQLYGCKNIVSLLHQLIASNILNPYAVTNDQQLLNEKIRYFNIQIYNICKKLQGLPDGLIKELQSIEH